MSGPAVTSSLPSPAASVDAPAPSEPAVRGGVVAADGEAPQAVMPGPFRPHVVLPRAVPMALGYLPVGFAFAALAHAGGMPKAWVMLMSASIYACSSQLVAVKLLALAQPWLAILATCTVVNLRHVLMSTVMAPYVRRLSRPQIMLFSFHLCDEAFALHAAAWRERPMHRGEVFATNIILYAGWLAGNGMALVRPLPTVHLERAGLDFAPMGMFLGLLAILIRTPGQLVLALACAALSLGFHAAGQGAVGLVATAVIGASGASLVTHLRGRRAAG